MIRSAVSSIENSEGKILNRLRFILGFGRVLELGPLIVLWRQYLHLTENDK